MLLPVSLTAIFVAPRNLIQLPALFYSTDATEFVKRAVQVLHHAAVVATETT